MTDTLPELNFCPRFLISLQGNLRGCVSKPLFPEVTEVLRRETLKADPAALGRLMADHTQVRKEATETFDDSWLGCMSLHMRCEAVRCSAGSQAPVTQHTPSAGLATQLVAWRGPYGASWHRIPV